MDKFKINIIKSKIPIMWIDTSLIINLIKLEKGEISNNNSEKERLSKLHELLNQKVSEKKLLCPIGEQKEEIILGRSLIDESRETQISLSFGLKFKHRNNIKRMQIIRFMKSYIDREEEISLDYKETFNEDPIKKLMSFDKFIITFDFEITEQDIVETETLKKNINFELESLRQKSISEGITFEQQLQKEYQWLLNEGLLAFLKPSQEINLGIIPTLKEVNQAKILGDLLVAWDKYNGKPEGLQGFTEFINSDYYKSVPTVDISARLWAYKMTSRNPIESGDYMDIDQISAILPYCDFVFTDRKMKHLISSFGVNKKYKTRVYCMRDFDEIVNDLSKL